MSTIRLVSPEFAAKFNADIAAMAAAFKKSFIDFAERIQRARDAVAEQHRRDMDDELDWLGDWHRRTR